MAEVQVKVCGITTCDDAAVCHALGADYLGVIFAQSPRQVSADAAGLIRTAVPAAKLVGVFVDEELATLAETARAVGLDLIQLHGQESPDYCRQLTEATGLPLIKACSGAGMSIVGNLAMSSSPCSGDITTQPMPLRKAARITGPFSGVPISTAFKS